MKNSASVAALKFGLIYILFASFWISFSDALLLLLTSSEHEAMQLQTYKGWFFVLFTGILLYFILNRYLKKIQFYAFISFEAEQKLNNLINNLPGVVYRCTNDPGFTLEYVSPVFYDLTGYKPSHVTEGDFFYGDLIHPDDKTSVKQNVQLSIRKKQPYVMTYRIITADNKVKWVWEQGSAIFSPSGKVQALEGYITDFTDPKRAQTEILEAFSLGSEREKERIARELHDGLGQLLSALIMFAQSAYNTTSIESKNDYLKQIMDLSDQALESTRTLSHELVSRDIQRDNFRDVLLNFKKRVELANDINIHLNMSEALDLHMHDQVKLHLYRIVQEFTNNTLKYANATTLTINLFKQEKDLILQVKDDGEGFNQKLQEEESAGIGLTNMKSRAKILNANFKLTSNKDQGTQIEVKVPLK